jgi:hypothetical protein
MLSFLTGSMITTVARTRKTLDKAISREHFSYLFVNAIHIQLHHASQTGLSDNMLKRKQPDKIAKNTLLQSLRKLTEVQVLVFRKHIPTATRTFLYSSQPNRFC